MTSLIGSTRPYDPLSVSPLSFWAQTADEREETFRVLRRERPLSWHPPIAGSVMPPENEGVWVVTSHELVSYVSRNPQLFCSGEGFQMEELPPDIIEAVASFLAMDAPRHPKLRRLVSSAFTSRQIAKIHEQIRAHAALIVDELLEAGEGDFVQLVSKKLPMWTICEMLGLEDPVKREEAAHYADRIVSWNDEDVAAGQEPGEILSESLVGLLQIAYEYIEERRANPKSDLMTNLVNAEVDGERLTDDEIVSFFCLLTIAGNDTTRNSISHTAMALQRFPEQRQLLLQDYDARIGTAIEEFVRWSSPVMTMRRTATQDTELAGQRINKGEWVALIYSSSNRDEKVFDRPYEFDITRDPNPHQGFGGGGPHFCMGNFVARMQLREIFHSSSRGCRV